MSPLKEALFKKILGDCQRSGTKLILLNGPEYISDPRQEELQLKWRHSIRSLLKSFPDVDFLEINGFTHPEMFSDSSLFRDSAHLNQNGAELFTQMVGAAVKERLKLR
jgi:hypothetical protein